MSAMVIPTARGSEGRSGSAAARAREAWFAGSDAHVVAVPTPRRARPAVPGPRRTPASSRVAAPGGGAACSGSTAAGSGGAVAASGRATGSARAAAHRAARPAPVRSAAVDSPRPAVGTLRRPLPASHGAAVVRAEERPLRLTRRGRLVVLLLAALVLVAGVQGGQALADGPSRALEVTTYTVGVGETLWEIAAESARPGEDVRDVVLELQSLNGLATAGLDAGQEIVLPVQR